MDSRWNRNTISLVSSVAAVIIIIIIILYPRVYNARGLKTERIKTAEMTRGPECYQ